MTNTKEKIIVVIAFIPSLIVSIFKAIIEATKDTIHWAEIYFYHRYS